MSHLISQQHLRRFVLIDICPICFVRYGGFEFGLPLPADLQKDVEDVPKNRTLARVSVPPAPLLPVSLAL